MKQHVALVFMLLVVFLVLESPSRADTDAYFCTFKGYLAFEAREGTAPGVVGHVLRVVRLDPQRGIYLAGEVTLPALFTVYHLICNGDSIEVSGWNNVFTKYTIEFAKSSDVRVLGPTEYPGQRWSDAAKDGPAPIGLGIFGPRVAPLPLESLDLEHEYQLLRNLSGRQTKQGWEFHTKSEVVQRDLKGAVLQRLVLYERRDVAGD
jgi:hypothetical protein